MIPIYFRFVFIAGEEERREKGERGERGERKEGDKGEIKKGSKNSLIMTPRKCKCDQSSNFSDWILKKNLGYVVTTSYLVP